MSGALRLLLAVMVILSHFAGDPYYKHFGYYSVSVFFILSGFAITAALNEVYAFDLKRFWINRALIPSLAEQDSRGVASASRS
ncbi:hypothetical protein [Methylorubrum rhodesianum]|uniref:hypothetical protein n=1 Tax=Methylorubrum rhodesianum TaxID=29427 RepID=UPI001FEECD60|nr:hypothetical protein [Methylorubrum rhodesianum]